MQRTLAIQLTDRLSVPKNWVTDVVLVLTGSALVALSAQLVIRLPFSPVPITGQTFAVLLVGFVLGSQRGALSLALYLLEGIMGLPVFAGGGAGLPWLFGPSGGYLLGFVLAAGLVGGLAERGFDRKFFTTMIAFACGMLAIYIIGALWLSNYTGWQASLQTGVLPFLPGDLFKAILAALALPTAWKIVK
jgi:biotin transport system substrate-specific component